MSKRSGAIPEETRKWILDAATEEFLNNSYQSASLRRICSNAGLTTGAVYFLFKNKEEVFKTIINETTDPLLELIRQSFVDELADYQVNHVKNFEYDNMVIGNIIKSYKESPKIWIILLKNLNHPVVRAFFKELVDLSSDHNEYLINEERKRLNCKDSLDHFAVEQYVRLKIHAFLVLIGYNLSDEDMNYYGKFTAKMLQGAYISLFED